MRTINSAKNLASSLGLSIVMILMGFITRKIFVDNVGVEYLGLNGLLQNILGVMTLLEGGFATSVVYNMYKPLAEDDRPRILALLQLYRKVYRYIAAGVFLFALCIYPFIGYFVKDVDGLEYVSIVYFIFLFNSLIQYFTAYKWSIINSSQKVYKLTTINLVYQVGLSLGKMAILYYTRNYILYLVVEALFGLGYNIAIVRKANKLFPYIVTKVKYTVEPAVKKNIINNMKALFLHSIGSYFMFSTDNIIVSAYIGVGIIGLWSNYTLLTSTVNTLITQALSSFSESIGNLIAIETTDKIYEVFKTTLFINFIVISIPVILLWVTLPPFISWWLGPEYELPEITVAVLLLNFYINGMRSSSKTFKIKAGIFKPDRYCAFIQGIVNVILSLILVRYYGLTGVLAATGISILSVNFWVWPLLCYRDIFHRSIKLYFIRLLTYSILGFITLMTCHFICQCINISNDLINVIYRGLAALSISSFIYWLTLRRTEQFKDALTHFTQIIPFRKRK